MTIKVYDWQGNERDLPYLRAKYGDFEIKPCVPDVFPQFVISALYERAAGDFDPAELVKTNDIHTWQPSAEAIEEAPTIIVTVKDENGAPLEGVRIAWYWPDADFDGNAGPLGGVLPHMTPDRAVNGPTNVNGDVGFGMGKGAYYWPGAGQIGPHAVWAYGAYVNSMLILGLGMIGATDHYHFDVELTRVDQPPPDPPLPPPPGQPVDVDAIMELLDRSDANADRQKVINDRIRAELIC